MTTGHVDHIGIGVPDLAAAKRYYDELMPIVGFKAWFRADESQFNYGPDGVVGTQIFFYQALKPSPYSRHGTGLQHLALNVPERAIVDEADRWATSNSAEVVHGARTFPEYGEHCYSTFFVDPHGIMLEIVSHAAPE